MITLYELAGKNPAHRFSPYCWRIRMALAHKGLEPTTIAWRFHQKDQLPDGCAGAVPVLVDDELVVDGSTEIAYYLEERFATGPSLFGGPGGEAHCHFIIAWADSVLIPALFPIIGPQVYAWLDPADQPYFRASREKRLGMSLEAALAQRGAHVPALHKALAPLRRSLQAQAFLGGEEPSYADYAAFGGFQWARLISAEDVLADEPEVARWRDSMLELFDGLAGDASIPPPARGPVDYDRARTMLRTMLPNRAAAAVKAAITMRRRKP